jgi:DNA-nicking Smr family endonuclease
MSRRGRKSPRFDASDSLLDAPVVAQLDLHRLTADEVERLVRNFLETQQRRGPGAVVRIITGKGKNSPDGPVLLPKVRTLLKGPLARYVADWRLGDDGGSFVVKVR